MPARVRTAYYVYLSHLAESTLPMCCINVALRIARCVSVSVPFVETAGASDRAHRVSHVNASVHMKCAARVK